MENSSNVPTTTVVLTDPSCKGVPTGDVDDIFGALVHCLLTVPGNRVMLVICDDDDGKRYDGFMKLLGHRLLATFNNVSIIQESAFVVPPGPKKIQIIAPMKDETAALLLEAKDGIVKVTRQGTDDRYNFKMGKAIGAIAFCAWAESAGKLTTHFTTATSLKVSFNNQLYDTLNPLAKELYMSIFLFSLRKSFGLCFIPHVFNSLYSSTGFNGGPGNGLKIWIPLFETLRASGTMLSDEVIWDTMDDVLKCAIDATFPETTPETRANAIRIVYCINLYCVLPDMLVEVDGQLMLPNISQLGEIIKRPERYDDVYVSVVSHINRLSAKSTEMFDFVATYWDYHPRDAYCGTSADPLDEYEAERLQKELEGCLMCFSKLLNTSESAVSKSAACSNE
jgi:hypothetical protein